MVLIISFLKTARLFRLLSFTNNSLNLVYFKSQLFLYLPSADRIQNKIARGLVGRLTYLQVNSCEICRHRPVPR